MSYRHSAGFGKRIEFYIIGQMLREGLDVYIPLVDDNGIDAVLRKEDGTYVEIQIKARSENVQKGHEALFAAVSHEYRKNYWFIFYSEGFPEPVTWVLSSKEFIAESRQNKSGQNIGKRTIWFNGKKNGVSYVHDRFMKYKVSSLSERLLNEDPDWDFRAEVTK
ncbi:hypothetical protein [uncultured Victivallis sp.]|uniref:hypothetical protein n=1 Tax=uncultured Victivallis sp. TaxID=354118 RepID=UPI0025906750|nr:hypothetical protein [uncultured Victivallis sp.]